MDKTKRSPENTLKFLIFHWWINAFRPLVASWISCSEDTAWKKESAGIWIFKIAQTVPKLYKFKQGTEKRAFWDISALYKKKINKQANQTADVVAPQRAYRPLRSHGSCRQDHLQVTPPKCQTWSTGGEGDGGGVQGVACPCPPWRPSTRRTSPSK